MAAIAIGFHFQNIRLAFAHTLYSFAAFFHHFYNVHSIDLLTLNTQRFASAEKFSGCVAALNGSSHCIFVIFNHEKDRQAPKCCHIIGFVNLALIRCAVPIIAHADVVCATIFAGESKTGT